MAYEVVIDKEKKTIEVHSDLCDLLLNSKDNYTLNNVLEYINYFKLNEVKEFLSKEEYNDFEIIFCNECNPIENSEKYDEEYDDFYEEFDEDEEFGSDSCNLL